VPAVRQCRTDAPYAPPLVPSIYSVLKRVADITSDTTARILARRNGHSGHAGVLPPNSSHESMDTFRSLRLGLHAVKIPAQDLKSVSFLINFGLGPQSHRRNSGTGGHQPWTACCNRKPATRAGRTKIRLSTAVPRVTASGGRRSIRYNIAANSRTNLAVPLSGGGREPNANGTRNKGNSSLGVVALRRTARRANVGLGAAD